jgi:hypothetical protein
MKENLKREKKNELLNEVQIASLTTFHAIVDSGTESGVLDAAAKLWAKTYADDDTYVARRCVQSKRGQGAARLGRHPASF